MATTRFVTDQYTDKSITSGKLADDITIVNLTAANILSGNCKLVSGAGLTKNGSTLSSSNGFIFKYSNTDLVHIDDSGNMYLKGNLELGGTMNSITTTAETMEVADYEIILNAGVSSPYASGARISVDRGGVNFDPRLEWNETSDYWQLYDGTNTARIIDQTYGDSRYAALSGPTFSGDITVGSTSRAANSFVRVLAGDSYNAGFEAYGSSQGTGYLFVGQASTHGGGMYYLGDTTPSFATGETADYIHFYRNNAGTKNVVMKYSYSSDDVTFMGDITVSGNKVTFGNGSYISNETDTNLQIVGDGNTVIYGASGGNSFQVGSASVYHTKSGDSYSWIEIDGANRRLGFSGGTAGRDTYLYRDVANSLKTDGAFNVVGKMASGSIQIGTSTTAGFVLTADASGNGSWAAIPDSHAAGSDNQNVFSHIHAYSTGTTDVTNSPYTAVSETDQLQFRAGTNITLSMDATGAITIAATDTNTATAVDNILDGSNAGTAITYAPYAAQQAKLSFDTSTTAPTRSDRLNLNGYLYATKVYNGSGNEYYGPNNVPPYPADKYLSGVSGTCGGTITFTVTNGTNCTWNSAHTHANDHASGSDNQNLFSHVHVYSTGTTDVANSPHTADSQTDHLQFVDGAGIDLSMDAAGIISIAHADTSSQASVDNSNGTVIQDITLDAYGHITALGSLDLDGRYFTETEIKDSMEGIRNIQLIGGGNLSWGATANVFAWSSTLYLFVYNGAVLPGGAALKQININTGSVTMSSSWACAYITIPSADNQTVTVSVGSYADALANDKIIIATRDSNSVLLLRNGITIKNGQTWTAGEGCSPTNHTHANLTAGNGITGSTYNGSTAYTWSIASHAGTAGSIGTINVGADTVGVNLGNTSTTACAGNDARLSDARTPLQHGSDKHDHQKYARITYTGGGTYTGYQWAHGLGTAKGLSDSSRILFIITPNNPETHYYYEVVDKDNVKIWLDDLPYETVVLDVYATVADAPDFTSATANL